MNHHAINRASGAAIGFVIALVIFIGAIAAVKFSICVPAIDADRGAAISKSLAEIRKAEDIALTNPGWVDERRGIVRLPIETAMQLAATAWQEPAKARADLLARAEKAAAPAPTNAPPKPNKFE
jgi:hypothetical protein